MVGPSHVAAYVFLKWAAYSGWMYCGMRLVEQQPSLPYAFVLGFLRLLMGFAFGAVIWFASTISWFTALLVIGDEAAALSVAYLVVYVPIRWMEWGIVAWFLRDERGSILMSTRGLSWVLGGVAMSCAGDLIMIAWIGQIPVGFPC